MSVTSAETEKNNLKNRLFSHLDVVLDVSQKKFSKKRAKGTDRIKWGRLMVQAIQSYGALFKLIELEDLQKRIEQLEIVADGLNLEVNP